MDTNQLQQLQQLLAAMPHGQVITTTFNLYHMLFAGAGGAATWHLIIQNLPKVQDYCDSRTDGMIPWLFHLLLGKSQPQPPATAQTKAP